ncbi:queuosine precursor transporter [Aggregatilineales bacterium SYSU G02658]
MSGYKHLGLLTASLVAVLLISNVASTKILQVGVFALDGGTFLFPLAYIFGDVLTEVYGYKASRRVIYIGFLWLAIAALTFQILVALPPAPDWELQEAFAAILGLTPRIMLGSLAGYWAGEFANSYTLAKMKVATRGRWLWTRTIGSTLVGQAVDTTVFLLIAFWGVLPNGLLLLIAVSNYIFKVGIEVVFTPVTYQVVAWFKREEQIEIFDTDTDFNPFRLSDIAYKRD